MPRDFHQFIKDRGGIVHGIFGLKLETGIGRFKPDYPHGVAILTSSAAAQADSVKMATQFG